jgi:serine/threonine protein kinase
VCPLCGYKIGETTDFGVALPYGTLLCGRYFIGRVLGQGGFGITYLGYDTSLECKIAVKEYYPAGFAGRKNEGGTHTVYSYPGGKEEFFERGLARFIKEAQRLSKFRGLPGVVGVNDVLSENGTAYIVMNYLEGATLAEVLKNVGTITEKTALEMFIPIIKTLGTINDEGIIHRDLSPDNIMIDPKTGTARLIDFGAAIESSVNETNNSQTVAIVKFGYAAEELYDSTHKRQGTWSDVYGICAVLYKTLEGIKPPDAPSRPENGGDLTFPVPISETVKNAIIHGMAVKPENRTQTMKQLLEELTAKTVGAANENSIRPQPSATASQPSATKPRQKKTKKPIAIIGSVLAACLCLIVALLLINKEPEAIETSEETMPKRTVRTINKETETEKTEEETEETTEETTEEYIPIEGELPPAKSYFYTPPNYEGLYKDESVKHYDNGDILAYSHLNDDGVAGFIIDYNPNEYLYVAYGTTPLDIAYDGESMSIEISLNEADYGRTYIGEYYDALPSGDFYEFNKYSDPSCRWYTAENNSAEGPAYYFDGTDMYIEYYENNKLTGEPEKLPMYAEEPISWSLDDEDDLFYVIYDDLYSGFDSVSDDTDYFGYLMYDNGNSYRGQISDEQMQGLGIYVWENGDVFIGQFENNDTTGYGLYKYATGQTYFVNHENGERVIVEEIEGLDIDTEALFG